MSCMTAFQTVLRPDSIPFSILIPFPSIFCLSFFLCLSASLSGSYLPPSLTLIGEFEWVQASTAHPSPPFMLSESFVGAAFGSWMDDKQIQPLTLLSLSVALSLSLSRLSPGSYSKEGQRGRGAPYQGGVCKICTQWYVCSPCIPAFHVATMTWNCLLYIQRNQAYALPPGFLRLLLFTEHCHPAQPFRVFQQCLCTSFN